MIIIIASEPQEVINKIISILKETKVESITCNAKTVQTSRDNNDEIRETVISLLKEGRTPSEVASITQVPIERVRAYKAHLTLGRY